MTFETSLYLIVCIRGHVRREPRKKKETGLNQEPRVTFETRTREKKEMI